MDTVVANEIVSGMVWRSLRYSELKYGGVLRNLDIFGRSMSCEVAFSFIARAAAVTMVSLVIIILVS